MARSRCMVWYGIPAFFVQLRLASPLGPSVYRLVPSDLCSLGGYPTTDSTWTLVAASAEGTRCYSRRSDRHPSLQEIFSGLRAINVPLRRASSIRANVLTSNAGLCVVNATGPRMLGKAVKGCGFARPRTRRMSGCAKEESIRSRQHGARCLVYE